MYKVTKPIQKLRATPICCTSDNYMGSNRELSTNLHFGWTNNIFDDCTIIAEGTHFIKDIPSPWL